MAAFLTLNPAPTRRQTWLAFATLYLLWGSTYLAIRIGAETIPPFLMSGVRFAVAGGLMLGWAGWRGKTMPTRREWLGAAGVGCCLVTLSNGPITWAEQRVPSGLVSLFAASTPLLIALINRWRVNELLGRLRGIGLLFGTAGLLLLGGVTFGAVPELSRIAALILAPTAWAVGSTWGRTWPHARELIVASSAQMLAGGLITIVAGVLFGEVHSLDLASISARSIWAWAFLAVFGSMIGFSVFQWLMSHLNATAVASYTYVNPVVAVFLGVIFAGEALSGRALIAILLLIPAVIMVVVGRPPEGLPATDAGVAGAPADRR